MIVLIMGVAGAGKTTIGCALAEQLGWRFADADEYHSPANIAKMRAGIPLTDADRAPWLQFLRAAILAWIAGEENAVLACSALKAAYRAMLVVGPDVKLVYLRVDESLARGRLLSRSGHYMHANLAHSQFETLEEPQDALTIDGSLPVNQVVTKLRNALGI
ncbi:MAG TPA: gluconokinase [Terriglobales bacterium]|nr:gluconokinase [Terriglobales bacterium]